MAQWRYAYPTTYRDDFGFDEGPRAVPVVPDGVVYTFGAEGQLHAIDFAKGTRIWSEDTMQRFGVPKGFFGAAGSPLVEDGRVLANVGGQERRHRRLRRKDRKGPLDGDRRRGELLVGRWRDDRRTALRDLLDARGARRAGSGDRAGPVSASVARADGRVGERRDAARDRRPDFRVGASTDRAPACSGSTARL